MIQFHVTLSVVFRLHVLAEDDKKKKKKKKLYMIYLIISISIYKK